MGELIGLGFILLGAYGLSRTYLGFRRGVIHYYVWSRGFRHKEEIRRDRNPHAFGVHVIVPVIINAFLLLLGLFELFMGDIFLL
jgi:hypothetical protein